MMIQWRPLLDPAAREWFTDHYPLTHWLALLQRCGRQIRRRWRKHRTEVLLAVSCVLFIISVVNRTGQYSSRQGLASGRRHVRDLSLQEEDVEEPSSWWSWIWPWSQLPGAEDYEDILDHRQRCIVLPPNDDNGLISEAEEMEKRKYRGCVVHLLYFGSSRLGNLLIKYSMLYAFRAKYKINVYITNEQSSHISKHFQHLSISTLPIEYKNATWHFTWYRNLELILPCPENIGRKLSCFPDRPHEHCVVVADWPPKSGFPDFSPHLHTLAKEFTFSNHIQNEVSAFLHHVSAAMDDVTYVGVHVRATDQNIDFVNSYQRNLPAAQYFSSAMTYFRSMYENVLFLVATDDRQYAMSQIQNDFNDIIFTGGYSGRIKPVIFDMALLAHCNHTIVSVGTFGFWGSMLSGGTVVAPSQFRGENTSIYDLEIKRWDRQNEWFTWS